MKILNISHANCTDGILASHALHSVLSSNVDCDYVFMQYGSELPSDVMEFYDYVIITDFSFSRAQAPTIVNWLKNDVVVILIDHHEGSKWISEEPWCPKDLLGRFVMVYSETESGALITHNLFTEEDSGEVMVFGDVEELHLFCEAALEYDITYADAKRALYENASDYDLFTKSTLRSSHLNEYVQFLIGSIGYSDITEIFDTLTANCVETVYGYTIGRFMYDAKMAMVKTVYNKPMATINAKEIFPAELITWKDPTVMIFNSPSAFTNEGCESVMNKCSFAMSWKMIEGNAISVSLRGSRTRDIDIRPLAEHFGGSGHATACGFRVDVGSPMHTYLTTGVTPKMTATKKARDKYAMRQSCIGATYKARSEHQRKEWAAGRPYHNMVDDECTPNFNCCHWGKDLTSVPEVKNVTGELGKKTSSKIMDNMFVITGANHTDKTRSLVKELLDPTVISSFLPLGDVIILTRSATDEFRLREEIIRLGSDNISNGFGADKIKEFSDRALTKFFDEPPKFIIIQNGVVCKFLNKLRDLKEDSLLRIYIDGCSEELRSALKVYAESPNISIYITTNIPEDYLT